MNLILSDEELEEFMSLETEGMVCNECRRISWAGDETYDCGRNLCVGCCSSNVGEWCEKCYNKSH